MWLGFDTCGYDLARGIDILVESLTVSASALEARRVKVVEEYAAYEAGVANGTIERIGEYEEGTGWIWEQSQHYEYDLDMIPEVGATMRKAHVMALYHHWERVIGRWAEIKKPKKMGNANHEDFCAAVLAAGFKVHPRMGAIRDLNNALKHNSGKFGRALRISWPELFEPGLTGSTGEHFDWFSAISINESHINEIIQSLRESGPPTYLPRPVDWIDAPKL